MTNTAGAAAPSAGIQASSINNQGEVTPLNCASSSTTQPSTPTSDILPTTAGLNTSNVTATSHFSERQMKSKIHIKFFSYRSMKFAMT